LPELVTVPSNKLLAVDRGINNHIVTSNGAIVSGRDIKYKRDRLASERRRLQRNGSASALQRLRKASGKEHRHATNINHQISKLIVAEAVASGTGTIVLEDLTGIRTGRSKGKRVNTLIGRWPFYQLQTFIEYKAKKEGVKVVYVNPYLTSQTCHNCGEVGSRNGNQFSCICGLLTHADLNASLNLVRIVEEGVMSIKGVKFSSARGVVSHPYVRVPQMRRVALAS